MSPRIEFTRPTIWSVAHAEAPEVELDLGRQILDLRGGVRLTRGQGWLQADRATIDIASAKVTLTQVKGSIPVPPAK